MSILDSIKSERSMSFSHWRYRILHWAFNVKNPDQQNLSYNGLPMYLYTHYCPLFHLTNLIVLVSPAIIALKVAAMLGRAIAAALTSDTLWNLKGKLAKIMPERKLSWLK